MNKVSLLYIACPVCRSYLHLRNARSPRSGRVSSGNLYCFTCGYHGRVRAWLPVLTPPGGEAVYRDPFTRAVGKNWRQWTDIHGWDALAGRLMDHDFTPRSRPVPLPPRIFRKSIYEGSDYYYRKILAAREQDDPDPGPEMDFLVTRMITHRPRRLLEIGAGSGRLTRKLIQYRTAAGKMICTDIDYGKLKILEGHVRRADTRTIIQPVVCDMRYLSVPAGHFDAVVSHLGLADTEGIDRALTSIFESLRPGGRFWMTEPAFGTDFQQGENLGTLLLHGLRNKLDLHHGENDLINRLNRTGFAIESVSRHKTFRNHYTMIAAMKK